MGKFKNSKDLSIACSYVKDNEPSSTATWSDKFRRMSELCENDKAFWVYDNCLNDDVIIYYKDIAYYCVEYTVIDVELYDSDYNYDN